MNLVSKALLALLSVTSSFTNAQEQSSPHPLKAKFDEDVIVRTSKNQGLKKLKHATRNMKQRIYNGVDVPNDTYPWFAFPIDYYGYWKGCGGTLISSQYVLTAAHCFFSNGVYTNDSEYYFVGTLCMDSANCGQYEEYRAVESTTIHPNYDNNSFRNDFALIKLSSPISDKITPVNIDDGSYSPQYDTGKGNLWAIGFGTMEDQNTAYRLQHVEIKYVSNSDCTSDPYDYPFGSITDEMMCARDNGSQDACQGDSGGPLYDSDANVLVGVTSWGNGCGLSNYPGVYARISSQYDWIKSIVCEGSSSDPSWCNGLNDSTCKDSPLRMKTWIEADQRERMKSCEWVGRVAERVAERCALSDNESHCPVSCGLTCENVDSAARFKIEKPDGSKINRYCSFVANNPSERCAWEGVADTCRKTCAGY